MNRVIVLLLCLASAGGIVGYTHYTRDAVDSAAVYTVQQRTPEPTARPPAATAATTIEPGDRAALARALQRELKRVGCYSGEITGVWTTSSRMAMKAFTDRVNATLPIDTPDQVLLSLVQGHRDRACGTACPTGQTATESDVCVPNAVLARAAKPASPADASPHEPADKANAALPLAGAATALALAAPAAVPRPEAKATDSARLAAVKPQEAPATDKKALGERVAPHGGPVPPEGMRERRTRRSAAASRPPKVVRDFLKVLGFK